MKFNAGYQEFPSGNDCARPTCSGCRAKPTVRLFMETRLEILVAEDDPNDAFLLQRAFDKGGVKAPVHFVHDGQEAVDYLAGGASSGTSPSAPGQRLRILQTFGEHGPEHQRLFLTVLRGDWQVS